MYDFTFRRPGSVDEALQAFAASGEARFLAGGQSLVPMLKHRLVQVEDLIDLGKVPGLDGIGRDGDAVVIGARAVHAAVADSDEVRQAIPALAELAGQIGDPQVRNAGTLGGSLANNDPAADYPAAALALGATIRTSKREIAADDFFVGMLETALEDGELIREVSFPVPDKAAYVKFRNPASRYAIVGVFVARFGGDVRVAVTGAAPCVFRATQLEEALRLAFRPDVIAGIPFDPAEMNADMHASAEYRAHLIGVLAKRAVAAIA